MDGEELTGKSSFAGVKWWEIGIHMFMWFRRDLDMGLDLAG